MSYIDEIAEESMSPKHYVSHGLETDTKSGMILDILDETDLSGKQKAYLYNALKYYDRMGSKAGESAEKDAGKCANYLYKCIKGVWLDYYLYYQYSPKHCTDAEDDTDDMIGD